MTLADTGALKPYEYPLRDYQQECVDIIDSRPEGRYLVQMATGCGKTVTFSRIDRSAGKVLIISHRDELVRQPVKYYPPGTVSIDKASEHADHGAEVISASIQTLGARLENEYEPGEFDTVITDECHHALAPSYRRVIDYLQPRRHIGFTATPQRGDDRGLDAVFDEIVFKYDIRKAIKNGYLCDLDCRIVSAGWNVSGVKTARGDFALGELDHVVNNALSNAQVAEAYKDYRKGPTLLFATSVAHADALSELIPRSAVVSGKTPADERTAIIERFRNGEVECLINVQVFTEGTDMPWVKTVLLARPTQSSTLYAQMVGRGLRLDGDKDRCTLIDCVGIAEERKLCTPATLVGLNKDDFPEPGLENGSLIEMESRVEIASDTPLGWYLLERKVDLFGLVAWVTLPSGAKVVSGDDFSITVSAPDILGHCEAEFIGHTYRTTREFASFDEAEQAAYDWLSRNLPDKAWIWDAHLAQRYRLDPASSKQLALMRRYIGDDAMDELEKKVRKDEGRGLTKREAQVIIAQSLLREEQAGAERYGKCPFCGRGLRRAPKTVQCFSNKFRKGEGRYAGCGFAFYHQDMPDENIREIVAKGTTVYRGKRHDLRSLMVGR